MPVQVFSEKELVDLAERLVAIAAGPHLEKTSLSPVWPACRGKKTGNVPV